MSLFDNIKLSLALVGVGFLMYTYYELTETKKQLAQVQVDYAELEDEIARSKSTYVTQEEMLQIAEELSVNFKAIKEDMEKLGAELKGVNKTKSKIAKKKTTKEKSTKVIKKKEENKEVPLDVHRYTENVQQLDVTDSIEQLVATVDFDASEAEPWSYEVPEQEINVTSTLGEKEDGTMMVYTEVEKCVNTGKAKSLNVKTKSGKQCAPVNIDVAEFYQVKRKKEKFRLWNPHLELSLLGGIAEDGKATVGAEVGVPIMSYGASIKDNKWRFTKPAIGGTKDKDGKLIPHLGLTPAEYNLGKNLPLLDDTWVGLGFGVDFNSRKQVNLQLGTTF